MHAYFSRLRQGIKSHSRLGCLGDPDSRGGEMKQKSGDFPQGTYVKAGDILHLSSDKGDFYSKFCLLKFYIIVVCVHMCE